MRKQLIGSLVAVVAVASVAIAQSANEALFEAARAGDTARIEAALARGAEINSTARYNVTPLIFAASNGRLDAVKLLVARGANVNAEDTFYRSTAAGMALGNGHIDVAVFLFQNGWDRGADYLMLFGVQTENAALVKTALAGKVTRQGVEAALSAAERLKRAAFLPILKTALDTFPAEPAFTVDTATLGRYAGTYRAGAAGMTMTVTVEDGSLTAQVPGQPSFRLRPSAPGVFRRRSAQRSRSPNAVGRLNQYNSYRGHQRSCSRGLPRKPQPLRPRTHPAHLAHLAHLAHPPPRALRSTLRGTGPTHLTHPSHPTHLPHLPHLPPPEIGRRSAVPPQAETQTVSARSLSGTSPAARTSNGRRRSQASQTLAQSRGEIASS